MNVKEKSVKIILNFLKENKNRSFTVKEIGEACFSNDTIKLEYFHNVTEFLRLLNDNNFVTWTLNSVVTKRRNVPKEVSAMGGKYQYHQGDGIDSHEKIITIWKQSTIDFLNNNPRKAFTTTQIAKNICGDDIEFINSQTIVMRELEMEKQVTFYNEGSPVIRGKSSINGKWLSTKRNYITFR